MPTKMARTRTKNNLIPAAERRPYEHCLARILAKYVQAKNGASQNEEVYICYTHLRPALSGGRRSMAMDNVDAFTVNVITLVIVVWFFIALLGGSDDEER